MNIRVIHVEHADDGLRLYIRLPMAYLVADKLGPPGANGQPAPAPYTRNAVEQDQLMHYLDVTQLNNDPAGLAALIIDGHKLTVDGKPLGAEFEQLRVYPAIAQPPFADLGEARRSFQDNADLFPLDQTPGYVGDTVVDVMLWYRSASPVNNYQLSSTLTPGLPGQQDTANLILDHGGDTLVFRERGLLAEPVNVSRSALAAAYTFIVAGIKHILSGYDHLLFVLCLTIGAASFTALLWRVTGFTAGHTITLIGGFLGYAPSANWFAPAVELGIALSIIYAAIAALTSSRTANAQALILNTAIGLLHGLGFSYVLREILQVNSPNLWQSLLAFNVGVELGQLAVVILVWPLFYWLARRGERPLSFGRWSVAIPCIMVAAYWASGRGIALLQTLA